MRAKARRGGVNMKKLNLKRLNFAAWLTLFVTYLMPYRFTDGFETSYGYPIPFVSIYNSPLRKTPFYSMSVNLLAVIIDVLILYLILSIVMRIWNKLRRKEA